MEDKQQGYKLKQLRTIYDRMRGEITLINEQLYVTRKERKAHNITEPDKHYNYLRVRACALNAKLRKLKRVITELEKEAKEDHFDALDKLMRNNHNRFSGSI